MSIPVVCLTCDHHFSVRDEYAGKRGKCPSCGSVFQVGSADSASKSGFRAERPATPSRRPPARRESASAVAEQGEADPFSSHGVSIEDPLSPSARTGGGNSSGSSRRKRKHGGRQRASGAMPSWGWIIIGVLAVAVVGIGSYAATHTGADDITRLKKSLKKSKAATKSAMKNAAVERKAYTDTESKKADEADKKRQKRYVPAPAAPLRKVDFRFNEDVLPAIVKVIQLDKQGNRRGSGTGFIINDDGWIATNHHVIQNAVAAKVLVSSGTTYEVEGVIAVYPLQDLAIIKCKKDILGMKVLRLAPRDSVFKTGMDIWPVGNPGRARFTVTRGIVTRVIARNQLKREGLDGMEYDYPLPGSKDADVIMLEFDARIFPGNSGGPLLNENMEVIGINTLQGFFPMKVAEPLNPKRQRTDMVPTFGLASHVRYLHKVLEESKDNEVMSFSEANRVADRKESEGEDSL